MAAPKPATPTVGYDVSQTGLAAGSATWWLDVETTNSWSADRSLNLEDIRGSLDFLAAAGVPSVGISSTGYQWGQITGGAQLGPTVPDRVAGAATAKRAPAMCTSSFRGGGVWLAQYPSGGFDADHACGAAA